MCFLWWMFGVVVVLLSDAGVVVCFVGLCYSFGVGVCCVVHGWWLCGGGVLVWL